jgi:molecular chaperone DnaJ
MTYVFDYFNDRISDFVKKLAPINRGFLLKYYVQKNYYDILQVSPTASFEAIKKSYRALAKKFHPDAAGNENNTHLFFDIQLAYETLINPSLRQAYHYKHFTTPFSKDYAISTVQLQQQLEQLLLLLNQLPNNAVNYNLLQYQLQQLVHIKFLTTIVGEKNITLVNNYFTSALATVQFLPYSIAIEFYNVLEQMQMEKQLTINHFLATKRQHQYLFWWQRGKIVLAIVIAVCLCLTMYIIVE